VVNATVKLAGLLTMSKRYSFYSCLRSKYAGQRPI
jgi:hypothetical protein